MMDPQVPASFIPKKPVTSSPAAKEGAGLLLIISIFIFAVSLLAAGLAFGYESYLNNSIASESDSLQKDQAAFDVSTINDLVRLDSRINQATTLLNTHIAPSAIFNFLSQETLQNVQFTSFQYDLQANGSGLLTLNGVADSFSTVALQSDQFGNSSMLRNIIFSNLNTDPSGRVLFTVQATVSPSLLLYSNNLAAPSINQSDQLATSSPQNNIVPAGTSSSSTP